MRIFAEDALTDLLILLGSSIMVLLTLLAAYKYKLFCCGKCKTVLANDANPGNLENLEANSGESEVAHTVRRSAAGSIPESSSVPPENFSSQRSNRTTPIPSSSNHSVANQHAAQQPLTSIPHEERIADAAVPRNREIGVFAPFVEPMVTKCMHIANLLGEYQELEGNYKEIVRWCKAMQDILRAVEAQIVVYPALEKNVNMDSFCFCEEKIRELVELANQHNISNQLHKFSLSQETKLLMEEISKWLMNAVSAMQLKSVATTLEVNMIIDHDMNSLLTAADGVRVQWKEVLEASMENEQSSTVISPEILSESMEDDQVMTVETVEKMKATLQKLEVLPSSIRRIDEMPIGTGGFSKVYKVQYMGNTRAAKEIQLTGLSTKLIQKVYRRFAKELFILSELRGPRIVSLHGCAATLTEMTLILEYMSKGCLKTLLKKEVEWRELAPGQRHRVLLDAAEGMLFLHDNDVAHRDLKSANILITDDFRGKLTDFGLSKTTEAISSGTASDSAGGTLAWQAPEVFHDGIINHFQADCYSFGIVAWEVLMGVLGEEHSRPWAGKTEGQIILAVLNGERPVLPDVCVTDINVQFAKTVKRIMNQCLDGDPKKRPSFLEIVVPLSTGDCQVYQP